MKYTLTDSDFTKSFITICNMRNEYISSEKIVETSAFNTKTISSQLDIQNAESLFKEMLKESPRDIIKIVSLNRSDKFIIEKGDKDVASIEDMMGTKYSYIVYVFLINKAVSQSSADISFTMNDFFQYTDIKPSYDRYGEIVKALDDLKKILYTSYEESIAENSKRRSTKRRGLFSSSIVLEYNIELNESSQNKFDSLISVKLGSWVNNKLLQIKNIENKFANGSISYGNLIGDNTSQVNTLALPQLLLTLGRMNENKSHWDREYSTSEYMASIWEGRAKLEKKNINVAIKKIDDALKNVDYNVVFSQWSTPKEFKNSKFRVVPLKKIQDSVIIDFAPPKESKENKKEPSGIYQYNLNMELITIFKTAKEASEKTGFSLSMIKKAYLNKHSKNEYKNFIWIKK